MTGRNTIWVLAGFLIGIGALAGYVAFQDPEKPLAHLRFASGAASADSAGADSLAAAVGASALPAGTAAPAADTVAVAPDTVLLPADTSAVRHAAVDGDSARADASALPREQVVRIFGSMKPAEAARVLEELDDSEARLVLAALPERKAGLILSRLSPSRAAAISRAALR